MAQEWIFAGKTALKCEPKRMKQSMSNAAKRILSAAILVAMIAIAAHADASVVSGVYTNRSGAPLSDRQLHFQNRVSGDMYLTRSGSDGSFSADLPPGIYDLRAERGLVIRAGIVVGGAPASVGRVTDGELVSDMLREPFERQGITLPLVDTAAPATAHVANAVPAAQTSATFWAPASNGSTSAAPPH
jgi:hypothetical protein